MNEHDNDCSCSDENEDFDIIIVNIDDKDIECAVLGVFEVKDYEYIALVPNSEEIEDEVLIFGYNETEEGAELLDIESEEEYNEAYEAFQNLITNTDFLEE